MPSVSAALDGWLTGSAGLTALVSTRIYPGRAPQDQTFPAVVYDRLSAARDPAFVSDADVVATFWRITSIGKTYDECEAVHDQVRKAVQRHRGTSNGVTVWDTMIETEVGPEFAMDPPLYEAFVDVQLRTTEV